MINQRPLDEYFSIQQDRKNVVAPLEHVGKRNEVNVIVRVHGGVRR